MNTFLIIGLYVTAAICVIGAAFTIATVGRPRKPNTPLDATVITCINAAIVVILILAAFQLQGW